MKISYKIYNNWQKDQIAILNKLGINVELGYDSFNIDDSDLYYKVKPYLNEWKVSEFYGTIFENEELNNTSLLVYNMTWANGYPQPEKDFGYKSTTYCQDDYCESCGTGLKQQSPFRIKKEPVWGTKKIFELNWIFDEIFVKKDIYEELFKPFNISSLPVLLYKKEIVIENVVQLNIPITTGLLNLEDQPYEICNVCGVRKYSPQIKGFFPSFNNNKENAPLFKTEEYFGSGVSAHRKIILTQELREKMLDYKIKSQFIPLKEQL